MMSKTQRARAAWNRGFHQPNASPRPHPGDVFTREGIRLRVLNVFDALVQFQCTRIVDGLEQTETQTAWIEPKDGRPDGWAPPAIDRWCTDGFSLQRTATAKKSRMRRFVLNRAHDHTGTSGTGVVAEGVQLSSGQVVLTWISQLNSVAVYANMNVTEVLHGHAGATTVEWIDP